MFEKWKRKKEPLPQIDIIAKWDKKDEDFYAPGALIRVTGGKNRLVENFSEDERLDRIVSEQDVCQIDEIITLIKAMGGLQHKRLFEIGDFFLQRCSYTFFPRYHNPGMTEAILDELMKLPRDTELENYLIDFMVECESDLPTIGKKILGYL